MRYLTARSAARLAAVAGSATALAGFGLAPAALASKGPVPVAVPCNAAQLANDMANAGSGETLDLAAHCSYALTGALPSVSGTLTLTGNSSTLDGSSGTFTMITVNPGGNLTVTGTSLNDATTTGSGAAIDNNGTVTLTNDGFGDDNTYDGSGGAIENDGTLTATNTSFTDDSSDDVGGAIDNESTAVITDSLFGGDGGNGGGGGPSVASFRHALGAVTGFPPGAYHAGATIPRVAVHAKPAPHGGWTKGSVAAAVSAAAVRLHQGSAHGNRAPVNSTGGRILAGPETDYPAGGAIYSDGQLSVKTTGFYENGDFAGGAIASDGLANLTQDFFGGNNGEVGGAVSQGYADEFFTSFPGPSYRNQLNIDGSTFRSDGGAFGGSVYANAPTSINRSSVSGGGADYAGGGLFTFSPTTVYSDTFSSTGSDDGGAIYTQSSSFSMLSTVLTDNSAGQGGGLDNDGTASLTGGRITGNNSGSGGGIYNEGTIALNGTVVNDNSPDNCEGSVPGCSN